MVITGEEDNHSVLIGRDLSPPRLDLGKPFGAISLPMGFSKKSEPRKTSILRVLQQEVFTQNAINRDMPENIIPFDPKPFMFVDIADVRVSVYNLSLPKQISPNNFTSYRLKNHRFHSIDKIFNEELDGRFYRAGVVEIANGYKNYLSEATSKPIYTTSFLNTKLISMALEQEEQLAWA